MIDLTGLSEFTIRGWENRYSAFSPLRTETGRREYKKYDVDRALLLRELTSRGHKIGNIAKLKNKDLLELFEKTEAQSLAVKGEPKNKDVFRAIELMSLQKWEELKTHFESLNPQNPSQLIADFFLPCITALVAKVEEGTLSIAQEHIFSSFLKEKIYALISYHETKNKSREKQSAERFVLATPEGDFHEIGLLLAHLLIRTKGCTSLYLGPNSPHQDLAETALRFNASHVLIVSTLEKKSGAKQELLTYISEVRKKVGSHPKLLVAGNQIPLASDTSATNFITLQSFKSLEDCLDQLRGEPV
jgi:MerR family transcriptional regulator, light-induced transcriptional regulator